jgi:hypothetical protein
MWQSIPLALHGYFLNFFSSDVAKTFCLLPMAELSVAKILKAILSWLVLTVGEARLTESG